jgi:hypothetical protein
MNEKNNKKHYLTLNELVSESLIRDISLFVFLLILIIVQGWENFFLLVFPLITFIFSLFFRIVSTNKKKTEFTNNLVLYNPLGLEKKHANRLFFCTLFQLILLFWLGGESLYNPHLINSYLLYFLIIFVFFYTFGFFWIFIDLWKYAKIEIIINKIEDTTLKNMNKESFYSINKIISSLKLKQLKITSYTSFIVFLVMNILNVILLFLNYSNYFSLQIYLPGLQILTSSYFLFVILIISPTLAIILFYLNYRTINDINVEKLKSINEKLPKNLQIKIIESLKAINNKIKEQLKIE